MNIMERTHDMNKGLQYVLHIKHQWSLKVTAKSQLVLVVCLLDCTIKKKTNTIKWNIVLLLGS